LTLAADHTLSINIDWWFVLLSLIGQALGIWFMLRPVRRRTAQLEPNSGSHVADAVNRIEAKVDGQQHQLDGIAAQGRRTDEKLDRHLGESDEVNRQVREAGQLLRDHVGNVDLHKPPRDQP